MDKNAIQKYAIWARNELITQVKQRAYQYGISDKGYGEENASVINGRVLTPDEKRQRQDFVHEIQINGFEQAVEEVAYTWFNRFVALRFMEVNDYLPTHVRVFSDASGGFNPEILKDVLHLDLEGLDKAKVSELLNANQTEELYRYLLLTQCNALNAALPEMFEKLGSYTEMLLPNNILKQESVLAHLVKDIDEDDWKDAVQIIGWMYQYYISERHMEVVDVLRGRGVKREDIPAATQLFTPDWIVRYMIENSLGRLWLELHPNAELKANWKYYLDEVEQTPEVAERISVLRSQSPVKSPEDIRLLDPCMGSGHILVYAFDVLMQIYKSEGYSPRDATKLILEKNIYGLDIDHRAHQLAYFSLMMKARQYNRRIFTDDVKPQIYHPAGFPDGEEFGSLVKVEVLPQKPEVPKELTLFTDKYEITLNAWNFKRLLAQKYDVVATNPPYLNRFNSKLKDYITKWYRDYYADLFSVFVMRNLELCKLNGYSAYMTPNVWMFIKSYEKLRNSIVSTRTISSLIQLSQGAFFKEATVDICTFVIRNSNVPLLGQYIRLESFKGGMKLQEDRTLEAINDKKCDYIFQADSAAFSRLPGTPIAYWVSKAIINSFGISKTINEYVDSKAGIVTGDDQYFIRLWFETLYGDIAFSKHSPYAKYHVLNKGGAYRRYYGNYECLIRLADLWNPSRTNESVRRGSQDYYFKKGIGWSYVGAGPKSFRVIADSVSGTATPTIYVRNNSIYNYLLGFLNSKVAQEYLTIFNPTVNMQITDVCNIPLLLNDSKKERVDGLTSENLYCSRVDWDAFETSWDFKRHPLLCGERKVGAAFAKWECEATERFDTLKANEEELNRIFIDIYGLQDELTPEVADKDVTVRRADLGREIRSLISYAIGCMFGRYSLDCEGLAYAGGDWDASKYSTIIPDKDNILPLCDDEYFEDDIVGRFVDFIRAAYGAETLEENLKFIADALGGKGTPREVIRSYFLNDFFADHCKIYQKRPIYWMFDSGKKNGFKALIYLHRYSRDLLAKMRTDYVHEQQERYRTQLSHIAAALTTATGAERAKLLKQQDKLAEQLKEITIFEEKVHHLADQNITIDLDDGVKKNYEFFADVLAKI